MPPARHCWLVTWNSNQHLLISDSFLGPISKATTRNCLRGCFPVQDGAQLFEAHTRFHFCFIPLCKVRHRLHTAWHSCRSHTCATKLESYCCLTWPSLPQRPLAGCDAMTLWRLLRAAC